MITSTLFPGRYVQGYGALRRLGGELSRFGSHGFLLCDAYVLDKIIPEVRADIESEISISIERFNGESSDEEIDRVVTRVRKAGGKVVAGIGGGKTLDTAKAAAHSLGLSSATVPTIASTDAPCSALTVIYHPDGTFKRYLVLPRNPDLVLVDTKVIVEAPVRFLVSGMGDALATFFEAESCRTSYSPNMTGDTGSMTAYALARLCYDTLLEYGLMARHAGEAHAVTPAFEHIVEANTLLSGLGFESGGLAAAHAIHNGLTVLHQTHHSYHGEKVTIGTLASLLLTDKPEDVVDEAFTFCESVGLPTTLEGIGLTVYSDEDLQRAADASCADGETIYHEPYPVTPRDVVAALKAVDNIGKSRLKMHREFAPMPADYAPASL